MMKSLKIVNCFVQKAQYSLLSTDFVLQQVSVPAMYQICNKCGIPVGVEMEIKASLSESDVSLYAI